MKFNKFLGLLAIAAITFTSCTDDDDNMNNIGGDDDEPMVDFPYDQGLLIANEGPFNNGFGSITYASADFMNIEQDIYQTVNSDNLGNIVQSISFDGDNAYIIANVGNRITAVDRNTFVESGRLESGLNNPRFMAVVNGNGYVTNWGDPFDETDDYVAIVNLSTLAIEGTIPVALGPEKIVYNGSSIYVAHKGAFGQNNIVSVINPSTNAVDSTVTVGDVPNGMAFDSLGNLWVLSGGKPSFTMDETGGQIARIETATNTVDFSFDFGMTEHPNFLNIDGNNLYFILDNGLFAGNALDFLVPNAPEFAVGAYHNAIVINGKLFGCDAGDFASNGKVEVYDLTTNGLETTIDTGIIPTNVYLNE